jgi:uncharacterized membrane protein
VLLALSGSLEARTWRISDYRSTIGVSLDGSTVVSERIDIAFQGQFNGIHRTLPIDYPGPNGTNYMLFMDVRGVSDGAGSNLKYETSTRGDFRDLKIYIPGAVDTTRTVQIDYTVKNSTRFFPDHDEFYWNVTGNDWPVPINHASAFVNFPSGAAGSLRAQAFTGAYGSADRSATADVSGSGVEFETSAPLPMRGGLTIDVYLPKGILREPGPLTQVWWFMQSNVIVLLPFWTLAVMGALWWKKGRDPDPGVSVAPMYEPPTGMSPAEVGTLVDDSLDPRDVTSTLIDLAVQGFVTITETQQKGLLFSHTEYVFRLVKPRDQWTNLAPHELVMLENVFAGGDTTPLSSLKNRFYTAIPTIRENVFTALKTQGMYTVDPASGHLYAVGGALVAAAPFVLAHLAGWAKVFNSPLLLLICGGLAALIAWLFARQMSCTSAKGARTRVAILGFQEFMNRVDADRLKRMPPDTFEKYLPFAMVLGVEHHWAQAFEGLLTQPPNWYISSTPMGMFNPLYFSNSMGSMASDVHDVFTSAPRSDSSGSGFSGGGGGGFSGGGFGGGGGDAF